MVSQINEQNWLYSKTSVIKASLLLTNLTRINQYWPVGLKGLMLIPIPGLLYKQKWDKPHFEWRTWITEWRAWITHVKLPWIFPGVPLIFNGAPGNIQGNLTGLMNKLSHQPMTMRYDYSSLPKLQFGFSWIKSEYLSQSKNLVGHVTTP